MNTSSLHDTTGVILVGGKSRRMGADKAFLSFNGKPLFERILDVFRQVFPKIVLVGNNGEPFAGYGLPIYPDIYSGSALGGLYTGLVRAKTHSIFVAPCDLAFPSSAVIRNLVSRRQGCDAVIPRNGSTFEPLFAVYSVGAVEPMRTFLEQGHLCIFDLYPLLNVRFVQIEELTRLEGGDRTFINLNTPEEFARAEKRKLCDGTSGTD